MGSADKTRDRSAGLLVFRRTASGPEFLLAHPGGPYWRGRDEGAWSIPKGLISSGEDEMAAARREFAEETGLDPPGAPYVRLTDRRQRGGKLVLCWLVEADLSLEGFRSNTFELEWPPRSGRTISVPECDDARYLATEDALRKILAGQRGFIEEAVARIAAAPGV
ncbi:MAG TPA: NUDIX domain-containing protein [Caulobacteraceae bacterium]|nr:NUDIX domain-containing protein [Caulobacteraceae bacterium]